MARFLTPLRLEQLDGRRWILLGDLRYESDVLGHEVIAPREFITDLASTPRLPFAYWFTGDRARAPAVIHDLLYQRGRLPLPDYPVITEYVDRRTADRVFWEAMGAAGPGIEPEAGWVRWLMWGGVRARGRGVWGRREDRSRDLNPVWTAEGWPVQAS